MTSSDLSASMRTALIIAYAAGPLTKQSPRLVLVECGAPMDCVWEAVESCGRQGLMVLSTNRADLTPQGFNLVQEIIGPIRARRIRSGTIEPSKID